MKQYKRSKEKLFLHSIFHDTMVVTSEADEELNNIRSVKGRTSRCHRIADGEGEHQPRGSCSQDRIAAEQREQSSSGQRKCKFRLLSEKRREHRPHCGDEDKEIEGLKKAAGYFPITEE